MLVRSHLGRLLTLLALGACVLAAGASTALAATWSANLPLSNPLGGDARIPAVAVAPNGASIAVWRDLSDKSVRFQEHAASAAFVANSSATLEAPGSSSAEGRPAVALNSAGAAVVAWAAGSLGAEVVKASYRPAGGAFSAAVTISAAGKNATNPDVAIAASGKAVVVWSASAGLAEPNFAEASAHGPSGGFSAAQVVNRVEDSGYLLPMEPRVAIDGAGNAIVVYPSKRPGGPGFVQPVQSAQMAAGVSAFGAPADLPEGATPDIAFGGNGRATVVWQIEGGIRAAEQTEPGGSFATAKSVPAAGGGSASNPSVGVDGAGNATVAFQAGPSDTAVFVATRPSGGSFGEPKQLSSAGDSGDAAVAVTPDGEAVAAWTRFNGSKETVEGSYRPAGGEFAAAELLSKNGSGTAIGARLAAAGIDANGNATVLWQRAEFFGVVFATSYAGGGSEPPPGENETPGGGTPVTPAPPATPAPPVSKPTPAPKKKALKCRKGFEKKKVRGKQKCVKVKKGNQGKR